ncbi:pectate lyase-like adhesive domain-containing protein [Listeria booriae]|uniref:pectate lyase-like adhesive domain-containing protein n=1 Tax=Listeria booriae TaxID=1552123 RepID=UPI00162824A2|nr:pectate lyase-like adhesive domain-containing protein [Listeria booriae]MBC2324570.1 cell surface protein [Listeria booriae]
MKKGRIIKSVLVICISLFVLQTINIQAQELLIEQKSDLSLETDKSIQVGQEMKLIIDFSEADEVSLIIPHGIAYEKTADSLIYSEYDTKTRNLTLKKKETVTKEAIVILKATKNGVYSIQGKKTIKENMEKIPTNQVNVTISATREPTKVSPNLPDESAKKRLFSQRFVLENEAIVSTSEDLRNALKNQNINKITLNNDLVYSGTAIANATHSVKRNLEIDGNGYTLNLGSQYIYLQTPQESEATIHIHNATLSNSYESFVDTIANYTVAGKWKYRFGNITINEGTTKRLARASNAEVTIYGENYLDTRAENFYVGSMVMEPNTTYVGNVNYYNYSVIWYERKPGSGTTGAKNTFHVGANSNVKLSETQSGTAYPAVYHHYQDMVIDENATFNVNMPGNAVRFDVDGSSFTAKKGAVINLTSKRTSGPVIDFSSRNGVFQVDADAYLYVIGTTSNALVSATTSSENKLILDRPAQYDLRNLGSGVAIGLGGTNHFKIMHSDIDLWNTGTPVLGPSSLTYPLVESLQVTGPPATQTVTSTNTELQSLFKTNKYRRISGMNQSPVLEPQEITDADLSIRNRIKIGMVPDNNGPDEEGIITYIPVYASENQAKASATSSDSSLSYTDAYTNADGYTSYQFPTFLKAGTIISTVATRGAYKSETSITVKDITPPKPVTIPEPLRINQKTIKGVDSEPGTTISYTINGLNMPYHTIVAADGTWEIEAPVTGLQLNDVLQFFGTDKVGNKTPKVDTPFHDALFPAGTISQVLDGELTFTSAPKQLNFGKLKIATKDMIYPLEQFDQPLAVTDTRSTKTKWQIAASINQALTSDSGRVIQDALIFQHNTNKIILTENEAPIFTHKNSDNSTFEISSTWSPTGDGLYLNIKAGAATKETYKGVIAWTLRDAP